MSEKETPAQVRYPQNPADKGAGRWWQVAKRTMSEAGEDNLGLIASGIAFNAFLALIPLLTAVVLSYGLVASPSQVAEHIAVLADALPEGAAAIIADQLQNMVQDSGTSTGSGLLLTLALSLFGALRGAGGIIIALNIVYNVNEKRSFVRRTGLALAIIMGLVILFILSSAAISVVNMLSSLVPDIGTTFRNVLQVAFWIGSAVVGCLMITCIYAFAPNREKPEWRWLNAGSLVATAVWVAGTFGFSFYVRNFGNFNATYGVLGAVIVFLTWLYLSSYILLLGAELNQVLSRHVGRHEISGEARN